MIFTLEELRRTIAEVERLNERHGLVPVRFECGEGMAIALKATLPTATHPADPHGFGAFMAGIPIVIRDDMEPHEWAPVYRVRTR